MAEEKSKLPSIEDLYDESTLEQSMKQNSLNLLLNQPPNPKWLKANQKLTRKVIRDNQEVSVPIVYIPIERIEYLLTRIFLRWWVTIKEIKQVQNSMVCVVTLHYQNPITNVIEVMDGVGAMPIQTAAGKGANELQFITTQAIQLAAPAAESYAVKDAAEKLGKLFGKDMNRADELGYESLMNTFSEQKKEVWIEKLNETLNMCQDAAMVELTRQDIVAFESNGELTVAKIQEIIARFTK